MLNNLKNDKTDLENLGMALNDIVGNDKTEISDLGDSYEIGFLDSRRYYEVDRNGNFREWKTVIKDSYAGDITKDETGIELDGSEKNPYEINCIEDLVAFSIMTYKSDNNLNLIRENFQGKYVILTRSLDFKASSSYNDATTTIYGDLNEDGVIEDIKTELTKEGEEQGGFAGIGRWQFAGIFDGKGFYLRNMYQNGKEGGISLFINLLNNAEIRNLNISGNIIGKWHTAGFITGNHGTSFKIVNCNNYADITGYNQVGGIFSSLDTKTYVINCNNYGKIILTGAAYGYSGVGGIGGYAGNESIIQNCINKGIISGNKNNNGGIVGVIQNANIVNCINTGKCRGGILGSVWKGEKNKIINCYNLGDCINGIANVSAGGDWDTVINLDIKNCYNLGICENSGIIGTQGTPCKNNFLTIENCYNAGKSLVSIIGKIDNVSISTITTNISNTYYDSSKSKSSGAKDDGVTALDESDIKNNKDFIATLNKNVEEDSECRKWKIGDDGYPAFE